MTAPYRPAGEYWILVLVGVLALGLGLGVAVAKYATAGFPFASASPSASPRPTAAASPSTPAPDSAGATADWTRYTDAADHFALRYPAAWLQRTCSSGGPGGSGGHTTLYLAPTAATLGACNSGFAGQTYIGATGGDQRATYTWQTTGGYDNVKTATVTVAGFTAIRQTATVPDSAAAGPVPGTKMVQYVIYAQGRTYVAVYAQAPSAPDTLADFDTMMKSTLELPPQ